MKLIIIMAAVAMSVGNLKSAEYFVGKQGNDLNDGLSIEKAFSTVQKGVDALQPGDTLTIGPGEYFEHVRRANLGRPDKDTLVRAAIPGTVLLRGDRPAPEFKKVDGYRFVYAADLAGEPQAVNETDSLFILEKTTGIRELEFMPGAFFHDPGLKKLYISSSDLQGADRHRYTVSMDPNTGLFLENPCRVTIAGLAARGFSRAARPEPDAGRGFGRTYVWGISLESPLACTVRGCTTFLNSGGICLSSGSNNVIEDCTSFANYSKYAVEGGNIIRAGGHDDLIRRCTASRSSQAGIRFYGSFTGPVTLEDNLAWGNAAGDYWIKGAGAAEQGLARRCVALNVCNVHNTTNCLMGGQNSYQWGTTASVDNVILKDEQELDRDREFADPDNFDFRLQAPSRFRGAGPGGTDRGPFPFETNIYYVVPGGDDGNDGLSLARAWKTMARAAKALRPGDTLYLGGGAYGENLELSSLGLEGKNIFIRGHGTNTPALTGTINISGCAGLAFERISFAKNLKVKDSRCLSFKDCPFEGMEADSVRALTITHARFASGLRMEKCSGIFLGGNIHAAPVIADQSAVIYSDYNSYPEKGAAWRIDGRDMGLAALQKLQDHYSQILPAGTGEDKTPGSLAFADGGPLGTPLGPFREMRKTQLRTTGPFLHSAGATTADFEWWTSGPARCELAWGDTPECSAKAALNVNGFVTFSLTGLEPGKEHFFKIASVTTVKTTDPMNLLEVVPPDGKPLSFKTDKKAAGPRRLFVAPDGDDRNNGLSREKAWKTVSHAADLARAGDTVQVAGGTYCEMVRVRSSGESNAPVTFKSMPGEKVVFDGDARTLTGAFIVDAKKYINFDGFYTVNFNNAVHDSPLNRCGAFLCYKSESINISRCFHDGRGGRGSGYSPAFLAARHSPRLRVKNCVVTACFSSLSVVGCPDFTLENCVFLRNLINAATLENQPDQKLIVRKNIFTDGLPIKVKATVLMIGKVESLFEEDNCYFLRVPDGEKKGLGFYGDEAYRRMAVYYGLKTSFDKPSVFADITRLSLKDYQAQFGTTGSFAANPGFKGALPMKSQDKDGRPLFMPDLLVGKTDLDFPDLFATEQKVVEKGIGLVPDDFKDFHFMKATEGHIKQGEKESK